MDLALNNLKRLICHKNPTNQSTHPNSQNPIHLSIQPHKLTGGVVPRAKVLNYNIITSIFEHACINKHKRTTSHMHISIPQYTHTWH